MTDFSTLSYTSTSEILTLSYTWGLWKELLWAGPSRIYRAVIRSTPGGSWLYPKRPSLRSLKVTRQLTGWSQGYCHAELLKSVQKVLHGNAVYNLPFPYREGEGGGGRGCTHATRKTANGDAIYGDRSFRQRVVTFAYVLLSRLP